MKKLFIFAVLMGFVGLNMWNRHNAHSLEASLVVGVVQIIDHPALERTYQGLHDELTKLYPGKSIRIQRESAQGNPALALQIAQKFVGQNVNMLVAIGTTAAQAARQASSGRVPVVFTSVTDPVYAKLVEGVDKPLAWLSGVSNFVPIDVSFEAFMKKWPEVKRIGMIYNPGEPNAVAIMEKTRLVCQESGIEFIASSAAKAHEVVTAAQRVVHQVDALWVNNDNTVLASFDALPPLVQAGKCLLWASDTDLKGYSAAYGADQYALGQQTALMVHKHLCGERTLEHSPIEGPKIVLWKDGEASYTLSVKA